MDQPNDQAINDKVEEKDQDTLPVSESSEEVEQTDQSVETDPQEESEPSDSVEDGQERKPSRIERNLAKALDKRRQTLEENKKLKEEIDQAYDFLKGTDREMSRAEIKSLFTDEERASGYFDPNAFESRVAEFIEQRAEQKVRDVLGRNEQQQKFRATVERHQQELEELEKIEDLQDEDVQEAFSQAYQNMNYLGDQFIGRVSPKQVYDLMFGAAKKVADKRTSEAGGKLAKLADDGAVVAGTEVKRGGYEIDTLYQRAVESGTDEDWAAYLKAKSK